MAAPQHALVPPHSKVNEQEKEKLLRKYRITIQDLPKIMQRDPAIAHLQAKPGDVIKIERPSKTAGTSTYYRAVME